MIKDLTSGKSEDLWFGVINQYEIKAGRTSDWRPKNSVLLGENNNNAPQKYWSPASNEQNHNGFQRFQTSAVCKITHNTQIKGFQGNFFIIIWKYHNNLFFFFFPFKIVFYLWQKGTAEQLTEWEGSDASLCHLKVPHIDLMIAKFHDYTKDRDYVEGEKRKRKEEK